MTTEDSVRFRSVSRVPKLLMNRFLIGIFCVLHAKDMKLVFTPATFPMRNTSTIVANVKPNVDIVMAASNEIMSPIINNSNGKGYSDDHQSGRMPPLPHFRNVFVVGVDCTMQSLPLLIVPSPDTISNISYRMHNISIICKDS